MRRWHSLAPVLFAATLLGSASCSPQAPKSVNSTKNSPTKATAKPADPGTPGETNVQATTKKAPVNVGAVSADPGQSASTDLGESFRDPDWFRAEIFAGATVVKQSRSQRDATGMYTSQFLFELAPGTTEEQCVERLKEINKDAVGELTVVKEQERTKLTGSAADYTVTHVCGPTPEGAMRSLVSYRWTRAPAG